MSLLTKNLFFLNFYSFIEYKNNTLLIYLYFITPHVSINYNMYIYIYIYIIY